MEMSKISAFLLFSIQNQPAMPPRPVTVPARLVALPKTAPPAAREMKRGETIALLRLVPPRRAEKTRPCTTPKLLKSCGNGAATRRDGLGDFAACLTGGDHFR